jgi:thymidylate synthase
MIASITGYTPGKLVYSIGDAHIYKNHIDQVREQLSRPLRPFPKLLIKRIPENIEEFEFSDLELIEYDPHPIIRAEMAV